jgi:GT2 family glycosyltransferase
MSSALAPPTALTLTDALGRVEWREGHHRRSLAERAGEALQRGDPMSAWLLADRLVRVSYQRSAIPYILRASALARLGSMEEASADLRQALAIDPHHVLLQQTLLDIGAPDDRRQAAAVLLAMPDGLGQMQALSTVAEDGVALIIHASTDDAKLVAHLRWRGEPDLIVRASDGTRHFDLSVVGAPDSGHPAFPFAATVSVSWPSQSEALALRPADGRVSFLAVPPILHRPQVVGGAGPAPRPDELQTSLVIVIPVHGDIAATVACLDSVRAACNGRRDWRVVVVEDATPEQAIIAELNERAQRSEFTLMRNPLNLGFARSVNRALATRRSGEDVLLLNADTILPPGAIERLAAAVASDPLIGTATPLSNNGEDTSFPRRFTANPMPEIGEIARLDGLAQRANAGQRIEMPNGVGFCLYIKEALLDHIGPLSLDYGRGYFEDVDFCLRGTEAGFRHVCAADVFVGHSGTRSFKGAKAALVRTNLTLLESRFPAHRERALIFHRDDPLKPAACRLEALWLREAAEPSGLVVAPAAMPLWLVRLMARNHAPGRNGVIARSVRDASGLVISLSSVASGIPQSLTITLAAGDASAPDRVAQALLEHRFGSVLLIDPRDLDPVLAQACGSMPVPCRVGLASAFSFGRGADQAGDRTQPVIVPGPLAEAIGREMGWGALQGPQRPQRPEMPAREQDRREGGCLAILGEAGTPDDWRLANAIARALSTLGGGRVAAFVGDPAQPEPPERGLFPAGSMSRSEATTWLGRIGAEACVFASRAYGIADPRVEVWPQGGMPTAYFDPRIVRPQVEGPRLRLPLQMSEAEASAVVAYWFAALRPVRQPDESPAP